MNYDVVEIFGGLLQEGDIRVMLHRDDVWKFWMVIGAIVTGIASHAIKLPAAWEVYMPYIEFASGVTAVVTALYIKPSGGIK